MTVTRSGRPSSSARYTPSSATGVRYPMRACPIQPRAWEPEMRVDARRSLHQHGEGPRPGRDDVLHRRALAEPDRGGLGQALDDRVGVVGARERDPGGAAVGAHDPLVVDATAAVP